MLIGNGSYPNPGTITLNGIDTTLLNSTVLANVLNASESLTIGSGGLASVMVSAQGHPQVFYAGAALPYSSFQDSDQQVRPGSTARHNAEPHKAKPVTNVLAAYIMH